MEKSEKITLLSIIVLVGFTVGVVYHYILGYYLGLGEPSNTFLFGASSFLCDFWGSFPYLKDFNPYKDMTIYIVYFPLSYILIFPFTLIKNAFLSYAIYISVFVTFLTTMNIKNFKCESLTKMQNFQNIFILTVISYPVLYILDRGNFDMFLFVLFGLFIYAFKAEKYLLASVLLAVQNACKPFTLIFLILFLFRKKYKEAFLSLILTVLLIIGGFMILNGNFWDQVVIFIKDIKWFKFCYLYYGNVNNGLAHSSSLFPSLKLLFCKLTAIPVIDIFTLVRYYDYLCYILTATIIFFAFKEKIFWKQITLLTCNMLLTPYNTYDYKLIFLFIPIWLFVNAKEKTRFDLAYTILLGLLFVPKNIIINAPYITQDVKSSWFSLEIFINPLILLAITGLIIFEQLKKREVKRET